MNVTWALRGALVHSLVVAMNLAPILHNNLTISLRCELGLCGFLLLDICKMLADELCLEMRLPRGSCFLAPQTQANLQGVALSGILICITKDPEFSPWRFGHNRLTELPIEQHFSYLRQQSPNSQLTSRSFWQAACRVSLRRVRGNGEKGSRMCSAKGIIQSISLMTFPCLFVIFATYILIYIYISLPFLLLSVFIFCSNAVLVASFCNGFGGQANC